MNLSGFYKRATCASLGLALFSGCQSNPYSKFYTNNVPPGREAGLLPRTGPTQYYTASKDGMDTSVQTLLRRGYVVIGTADFEAGAGDYTKALHKQADEVQAEIVLLGSSYAGTRTGVMPLMTFQPGQTSTTQTNGRVQANAYGTGGYATGSANYSGTSTTTTPGTLSTNYIPYSVQRNNYGAVFLRKSHFVFGARWEPLSDSQRRALQRNTGLNITMVVEGTPAFIGNILPGDILLTIDGEMVVSSEGFTKQTAAKAGQKVSLGIVRDGKDKTVEIRLNPAVPDSN